MIGLKDDRRIFTELRAVVMEFLSDRGARNFEEISIALNSRYPNMNITKEEVENYLTNEKYKARIEFFFGKDQYGVIQNILNDKKQSRGGK